MDPANAPSSLQLRPVSPDDREHALGGDDRRQAETRFAEAGSEFLLGALAPGQRRRRDRVQTNRTSGQHAARQ